MLYPYFNDAIYVMKSIKFKTSIVYVTYSRSDNDPKKDLWRTHNNLIIIIQHRLLNIIHKIHINI